MCSAVDTYSTPLLQGTQERGGGRRLREAHGQARARTAADSRVLRPPKPSELPALAGPLAARPRSAHRSLEVDSRWKLSRSSGYLS